MSNYSNPHKHIPTKQKHIDGKWWTAEYEYRGLKIQIKAREMHGMKAHIWNEDNTKVQVTLRYSYIPPKLLLEKAKRKIDSILDIKPPTPPHQAERH